jgi:hypothetical protein
LCRCRRHWSHLKSHSTCPPVAESRKSGRSMCSPIIWRQTGGTKARGIIRGRNRIGKAGSGGARSACGAGNDRHLRRGRLNRQCEQFRARASGIRSAERHGRNTRRLRNPRDHSGHGAHRQTCRKTGSTKACGIICSRDRVGKAGSDDTRGTRGTGNDGCGRRGNHVNRLTPGPHRPIGRIAEHRPHIHLISGDRVACPGTARCCRPSGK